MHGVVNFNRGTLFSWVCEYWLVSGVTLGGERLDQEEACVCVCALVCRVAKRCSLGFFSHRVFQGYTHFPVHQYKAINIS